jgi:hypothetical protein
MNRNDNAVMRDRDPVDRETGRQQGEQRLGQGGLSTRGRKAVLPMCSLCPSGAPHLHRE